MNKTFFSRKSRTNLVFGLFVAILVILGLTACGPRQTPEPAPTETAVIVEEKPTPTIPLIEVKDDGAPLAPQVIEHQPLNGQELSLGGYIDISFNQPMDAQSTSQSWALNDPDQGLIKGQVSWLSPRTMRFMPAQALEPGKTYHASLSKQARSSAGIPIPDDFQFSVQTTQQLQVSQVFPADGSIDIDSQAAITVIFNKPVVPLVIAEQQNQLPDPIQISPEVSGKGEWINTSIFVFRPDQYLNGGTSYTLSVKAGLADSVGETQLLSDYEWSFKTTTPGVESFWLTDTPWDVNPQGSRVNVPLKQGFAVQFRQPMDKGSVEHQLKLVSLSNESAQLKFKWNTEGTLVVLTPTLNLSIGTGYWLSLDQSALALDGGKLSDGLEWRFSTVPSPAIISTDPSDDTTQDQFADTFWIYFASPMRFSTLTDKVSIEPEPSGDWSWYYAECGSYGGNCGMYMYGLKPSTNYTVRIEPGMEDLYGNKTQGSKEIHFRTAAYWPSANLQMPMDGPAIYRVGAVQEFYAVYQNIQQLQLSLYKLSPERFASMQVQYGENTPWNYQPDPKDLVWKTFQQSTGQINERVLQSFKPVQENGDPLEPGFYFLGLDSPQITHTGSPFLDLRLIEVASVNLTFKTTNTEALVWVTDMTTGEPIADVLISVYNTGWKLVGEGHSDKQGLVYIDGLKKGSEWYDTFFAMADDGKNFGFASANWGSGVSPYDFGIWQDYYSLPNLQKAYVYTDRPLYRPGQPVYFKGVVRLDDDLKYSLPDVTEVNVTIESFEEVVFDKTLPLSEFGTFSGELLLDEKAALGLYSIRVRFPGKDTYIGEISFNVAEYRKPEFQVVAAIEPANVLAGDNFTVTVQADYFAGGPVVNGSAIWDLRASTFLFTPPSEYSAFSFTDEEQDVCYACFQNGFFGEDYIADGKAQLDENGQLVLTIPAELKDTKTSKQFRFETAITDFAGSSVAGRATVIVHQSEVYPGIRTKEYVGQVGQQMSFDLVALDWEGNPLSNQKVDVEIVERRWYNVQEQDAQGHITWTSSVEEIPAESFKDIQLDASGQGRISFTPEKGGVYRARITGRDLHGNPGKASTYVWVAGEDYVPWRQSNDRALTLVADRSNYIPGDTAEILIASPFEGEWNALVTVERGHISHYEIIRMTTNSTVYRLPITADMAPATYVSVLVIKGADLKGPPDFRLGLVKLGVERKEQELKVEVIPDKQETAPGGRVDYTVRVTDSTGQPVKAEVSMGLSDLAALSLSEPNSQPILDFFYNERGLSVWTAVPVVYNIENFNAKLAASMTPGGEGMGSGGGKGEGEEGVVRVRGNFPDTAYWQAQALTDDQGEIHVTVVLPDNLTTWRMDARAVTEKTLVGQAQNDIVSTKPLLVRPQTPRFFTVGDQATLGTAVHNNTDQDLQVDVSLDAKGITLAGNAHQVVQIPAHRQAYVTWQGSVPLDAKRVDLVFRAEGGAYADASLPPMGTLDNQGLPVYRFEVPETVGTSGQMLEGGTIVEAISLPPSWDIQQGSLSVEIAPSLAAGMTDGLAYLEHYPYECVEQTISRFLPNVLTTRALKSAGLVNADLEAALETQVNVGLQRLYNQQNPDGGWGWWGDEKSDPLTSAYVVFGLNEADKTGYSVSNVVLLRGVAYLQAQVRSLEKLPEPYLANRQAFILFVLAKTGSPRVSDTVKLYDSRQTLALYARAYLAQTLYMIKADDPRIQTLLSDFTSAAIVSSSGTHWEEQATDDWNWNTDTRTTAIVLAAVGLIDQKNPLNANAVRWLMSHRTQGHWASTQETAWTLMALTQWMESSGELQADYAYGIAFNGKEVGGGQANAETLRNSYQLKLDVTEMLTDQVNRLAIARETGPGNLYYTAFLDVNLPVDQVHALNRGLQISRSYYRLDDSKTPITDAKQGNLVLVRLSLVVPNTLRFVVVDDPLPAGLEAVDQNLETSQQNVEPQFVKWEDIVYKGWGWWNFNHVEMRDERVVLSADVLTPGTYVYTYLARASTRGTFSVIPTTAQEFYFPDVYGRGEGSLFKVTP